MQEIHEHKYHQNLTSVRGMVMTHRHRSDTARFAMNTFLAVLISALLKMVTSTNRLPSTPTGMRNIGQLYYQGQVVVM